MRSPLVALAVAAAMSDLIRDSTLDRSGIRRSFGGNTHIGRPHWDGEGDSQKANGTDYLSKFGGSKDPKSSGRHISMVPC